MAKQITTWFDDTKVAFIIFVRVWFATQQSERSLYVPVSRDVNKENNEESYAFDRFLKLSSPIHTVLKIMLLGPMPTH